MIKLRHILLLGTVCSALPSLAQQNPAFQIYRTYHAAADLLDKGEYVAAAQQYRLVEQTPLRTSNQPRFESQLTLLKEDAQYYEALCSLELGNDDAESQFLRFIKEHPENPLTKLAYFQVGRYYYKKAS